MKFLIKKTPDRFIRSVNDEISSILNRNFDSFFPEYIHNEEAECDKLAMPVELHEKDNEYCVKAELPGVKKEDLDIDIDKNHITINAKKEEETNEENSEVEEDLSNKENIDDSEEETTQENLAVEEPETEE